ncbi:MAG TPA: FKBP-type peptidyl-prolyl cis-trans isomerase [Bryobacteraceae bacterium]|nr:FKBP-type peptidyl-prolyl cis-trans isomerase [Bryobacteraceae bacterium]
MRLFLLALPVVLLAQAPKPAPQAPPKPAVSAPAAPGLATDDQKTIYALGMYMYRELGTFDLTPAEVEVFKKGFADAAAGKATLELDTWGPKIGPLAQARGARVAAKEKAAGEAFLAKAAAEPGAEKTASGLVYRELRAGTGASPAATDKVKVNYKGTLTNGTEFDSSYRRNAPAEFTLNGVIPCWTEGVQKMKVGGKASLTCPSAIAYGDRGHPPAIPGGATLVFEVELLEIASGPTPATPMAAPAAPAPPAAPGK